MKIQLDRKDVHLDTILKQLEAADTELRALIVAIVEEGNKQSFYTRENLTLDQETTLNQVYANHDASSYSPFRIFNHVSDQYLDLPYYKVDFTNHLKRDVVFNKSITKHPNGRPNVAKYFYQGVEQCQIRWEFQDFPGGLFQSKRLLMSYIKEDDTYGEEFLIKEKLINPAIPNQLEEAIEERIQARHSIVGEIKAVCSGALTVALNKSMEEVVLLIKPFWDEYKSDRESFVELATKDWLQDIATTDLATTPYTWLTTPIDANGTTCQQYMMFRLGY